MEQATMAEHERLILMPNSLVFYIDDTGDEQFGNADHPMFAFGGVAAVTENHFEVERDWRAMKAREFPQVNGALHAKRHLRDRIAPSKKAAVFAAMPRNCVARFGSVLTAGTAIAPEWVMETALRTLSRRCSEVAVGFIERGLWQPPGPVVAIFEQSARLAPYIPLYFDDPLTVGPYRLPVEGCFMPKWVANPLLEMADVVVN